MELKTIAGSSFRPNTSDNRRKGRHIYEKDESLSARIGALDQNRWRNNATQLDIAILNNALNFHGLYEKEETSVADDILGKAMWGKIKAGATLKKSVKRAMGYAGFALKRVPR